MCLKFTLEIKRQYLPDKRLWVSPIIEMSENQPRTLDTHKM